MDLTNVSIWKALVIWYRCSTPQARAKSLGAVAVVLLALVAGGAALGRVLERPSVFSDVEASHSVVQTRTETVERVVVQTVVKWRTRYVEVNKYDPTTGKLTETIRTGTQEASDSKRDGKTDTRTVSESDSHDTSKQVSISNPEGRWSVRAGAGLASSGGFVGAVGADYRFLGPLTLGLGVVFPVSGPGQFIGIVNLGLRL